MKLHSRYLFCLLIILGFLGSRSYALDSNGNGVSDVWEFYYYGYDVDPDELSQDIDGDGQTAAIESLFGTDPFDPASRTSLHLSSITSGNALFTYNSVSGIPYQPESAPNLTSPFLPFGSPLAGNGTTLTVSVPTGIDDARFLRLASGTRVSLDGDSLDSYEEALFGSSDSNANCDTGDLSDVEEFTLRKLGVIVDPTKEFTQPGVRDGTGDLDEDGISDIDELRAESDPADYFSYPQGNSNLDADRDGLRDAWEITFFGSISTQTGADNEDGDRLSNVQELKLGTNPTLQKTDGTFEDGLADRDADSMIDLWELEDGTNPLVSDANFNSANYVMLQGVMEHVGSADIARFNGTVMRATALGFEEAQVVPTTRKRFAVQNEVPATFISGGGRMTASELLYFRKGVQYQVEILNTIGTPSVPLITASFRWTTTGNSDELDNRSFAYEVNGKQWYVTNPTDFVSPVLAIPGDPSISPNPDPQNTQFTFSTSAAGAPNASSFPTGKVTVSPVTFSITRDGSATELSRVLRDEIVNLKLTKMSASPAPLLVNIDVIPDAMRMQEIPTRGNVQMYDFGTISGATVTPSITQVTLPQAAGGDITIKAVFNKTGTVRVRVRKADGSLVAQSQEFVVEKQIRKYSLPNDSSGYDFNQHDQHLINAAEYWGGFYLHAVDDVERLKAMAMTETEVGNNPNRLPTLRPTDHMSIGDPRDHVLETLHYVAGRREREVDPQNNSVRWLNYPLANCDSSGDAIVWGTCWLYHKAQTIRNNPQPPPDFIPGKWKSWDYATQGYNGHGDDAGVPDYVPRVNRAFRQGRHPTDNTMIWPLLTNRSAR